jgi:pyruvate/2-oxoglutarate dehydrogenase complex dihydrolipoamide dehydrogenase (E3) component
MHGIMPNEDRDAAEIVKHFLLHDGIRLLCCDKSVRVESAGGGKRLSVDSHGDHYDLTVDEILVGVGGVPNVEGLGLENAGVEFDKAGVRVNDCLQATNRRIYAAGDVCSRYKFTHAADAMARIVIPNALFFGRKRVSMLTIPWCTYTDPEVAHVGLYPPQADKQGIPLDTYTMDLGNTDRAILDGEIAGFLRLHVRRGRDKILGATLVARHAGEVISEITLAIVARAGRATIARAIHPYPTQAEIIKKAADAYSRSRLTPNVKRVFDMILKWRC